MRTTGSTAPANKPTPTTDRIRHAFAQMEPWDYDDQPTRAYKRGWKASQQWLERVMTAIDHGLMCGACGMPAHRGEAKARLDALLPEWVVMPEPNEQDEVERLGQIVRKLQTRISAIRRRSKRQYHALKLLPDLRTRGARQEPTAVDPRV